MAQTRIHASDPVQKEVNRALEPAHVPADALHGMPEHYKIKLRSAGYRLVYRVEEATITITVIAVGKRERNAVYKAAERRSDL